jgi:hypothetical protein
MQWLHRYSTFRIFKIPLYHFACGRTLYKWFGHQEIIKELAIGMPIREYEI